MALRESIWIPKTAPHRTCRNILKHLGNGSTVFKIFLDLSKVFDTIDHGILLRKLEYYGIKGPPKELFSSYFTNRKKHIQMNGNFSYKSTISAGVPQGSVLIPLLFIIYMNDMSNCSNLLHFTLYAADTTILSRLQLFETSEIPGNINAELDKINQWLQANKLTLDVG